LKFIRDNEANQFPRSYTKRKRRVKNNTSFFLSEEDQGDAFSKEIRDVQEKGFIN